MYRTPRYINKNDGQHNFFGEDDYINIEDGKVITDVGDQDAALDEQETPEEN